MTMMGEMIKGGDPEGDMEDKGEFFGSSSHDENMMTAMEHEMGDMSSAFGEMSGEEMTSFAESVGAEGMADMAASMDMGSMSESMGEVFGGSGDGSRGMIGEGGMQGGNMGGNNYNKP